MSVHSVRYVHCVRSGCTAVAPDKPAGKDEDFRPKPEIEPGTKR